jgi:hypothetical protein
MVLRLLGVGGDAGRARSTDTGTRREDDMLDWLRGLSDGKQGLVVAGGLGLIVVGIVLLIRLVT